MSSTTSETGKAVPGRLASVYSEVQSSRLNISLPLPSVLKTSFNVVDGPPSSAAGNPGPCSYIFLIKYIIYTYVRTICMLICAMCVNIYIIYVYVWYCVILDLCSFMARVYIYVILLIYIEHVRDCIYIYMSDFLFYFFYSWTYEWLFLNI